MKRLLLPVVTAMLILPAIAETAELGAYGTTLLRFSQQTTPGFDKQNLMPLTQYLGLTASGLADGNLSLNFYGWGRVDLGDQSSIDGTSDSNVSSAYLRYLFPKANGEIRAGRFQLLEGVARENIDGILAAADLPAGFRIAVFGGAPSDIGLQNDSRGSWLAGSRVSLNFAGRSELGISYLYAGDSTSQDYSPGTLRTVADRRELVGGDIWLSPITALTISGRTTYNTVTSGVAEHDYTIAVKPAKNLTITGNYAERNTKDLYSGTNLPFLFKPDSSDKITNVGGAVIITAGKPLTLTLDYRHTERDSYVNTDRFGGEIRLAAEKLVSGGAGYHRVSAGEAPAIGTSNPLYDPSYHEARGWFLLDYGAFNASLNAIGHFYDDSGNPDLNGKSHTYEITASAGFRPIPQMSISGDVSYGETAFNTSEYKGLVRVEFNAMTSVKGGSK
jgi:hypothetical protein